MIIWLFVLNAKLCNTLGVNFGGIWSLNLVFFICFFLVSKNLGWFLTVQWQYCRPPGEQCADTVTDVCRLKFQRALIFLPQVRIPKEIWNATWLHSARCVKVSKSISLVSREEQRAQLSVGKCNKKKKEQRNKASAVTIGCLRASTTHTQKDLSSFRQETHQQMR